jgi:uncharacterized protein involved in type VI secretion and phage assembly
MTMLALAAQEDDVEARGHVKGVAVATVTQNKDPQRLGRVRIAYPWDPRKGESYWARIAVPMAGKERGTFFLPEVGDEVLVAFERGDFRSPYVVGALWNGQEKPPAANPDGKNDVRLIRSRKGHELLFDDGDKTRVVLRLRDGKRLAFDDDGVRLEDGKGNR